MERRELAEFAALATACFARQAAEENAKDNTAEEDSSKRYLLEAEHMADLIYVVPLLSQSEIQEPAWFPRDSSFRSNRLP